MRYRITEFPIGDEGDNKFFVETGTAYKKHFWFLFYTTIIRWKVHKGYKTFDEALDAITQIKELQPIYHDIR